MTWRATDLSLGAVRIRVAFAADIPAAVQRGAISVREAVAGDHGCRRSREGRGSAADGVTPVRACLAVQPRPAIVVPKAALFDIATAVRLLLHDCRAKN